MIEFRPVAEWNDDCFASLLKWQNDPELRHLHLPRFSEAELEPFTLETAKKDRNPDRWMIFVDGRAVGHSSIAMDHHASVLPKPGVAWVGLAIGERDVWGTGVSDRAAEHLVEIARERGAHVMEAGVFSYNVRSLRFWKRHGFVEFHSIPQFTYWDGKWWMDIRLRRLL